MRPVSLLFHDVYVRDPRESGFSSQAADRYKLSLAEFEAQLRGLAEADLKVGPYTGDDGPRTNDGGRRGRPSGRPFVVTVDDGGVSYYTQIADRLEAYGWRGHCFVTTDCIDRPAFLTVAQLRDLDARGHTIGSHTASHPYRFHACPPDQMRREWTDSRARLEDILGHAVTTASVPGGFYSRSVARIAAESGIDMLFTSEPVTRVWREGTCSLAGRFTLRAGCAPGASAKLVGPAPWARHAEWAAWNVKGLVKPLLGRSYVRVANWVSARTASHP